MARIEPPLKGSSPLETASRGDGRQPSAVTISRCVPCRIGLNQVCFGVAAIFVTALRILAVREDGVASRILRSWCV